MVGAAIAALCLAAGIAIGWWLGGGPRLDREAGPLRRETEEINRRLAGQAKELDAKQAGLDARLERLGIR